MMEVAIVCIVIGVGLAIIATWWTCFRHMKEE